MTKEQVPKEVRHFIWNHIGSVQQLEVLLLLSSSPEKEWTVAAVGEELQMSTTTAANRLINLWIKGLIAAKEEAVLSYTYRPRNKEMDHVVQALAQAYREHRLEILEIISSKKDMILRSFSDSFRFRKEDKENG